MECKLLIEDKRDGYEMKQWIFLLLLISMLLCCGPCVGIGEKMLDDIEIMDSESVSKGQDHWLFQKCAELQAAIGGRNEIGEVLEKVAPLWNFPDNEYDFPPFLNQAGVYDWGDGEAFYISWLYQAVDENSNEFYHLKVELVYTTDEENRTIRQTEWLFPENGFEKTVRESAAYRWALGKKAINVSVRVEGT